MDYYSIQKDGLQIEVADSIEEANRIAEAWEEWFPDSSITILKEIER